MEGRGVKGSLREFRDGWPVLLGAMLSAGAGISIFGSVNGFFVKPLAAEFGWSRGQISLSSSAVLLTGLAMPVVGVMVDRYGPRFFILLGAALFAMAYAALAAMTGPLWMYIAIILFIGVGAGPATAPLVVTRPLVSAFAESRGLALAFGMSGAVVISTVLLPTLQNVIATHGWRAGYGMMVPVALVAGVGSFFLLKERSRTKVAAAMSSARAGAAVGHSLGAAARDMRFWLLALSMICISMASGAFTSQMQPLLSDLGVPGATAAMLGAWYAASVVVGRLGAGFLLDRLSPTLVGAVALSGPIIGMPLFLLHDPSLAMLMAGAALVGLSTGAEGDMLAFFTARYFGLKSFGAIFGVLGMFFGLSVAIGGIAAGFIFDRAGDYDPMLTGGAVLAGVSAAALFLSGMVRGRVSAPPPVADVEAAALSTPAA